MDIVKRLRICAAYDPDQAEAADEIERLRQKNAELRELLQNWMGCCFVDEKNNNVSFGMGVKKVWSETRFALTKTTGGL